MSKHLRIATFNLESLADRGPDDRPTLDERIAVLHPQLVRLDADILALQEINGQKPAGEKKRRLAALDRLLAETPYAEFHRAESTSRRGGGPLDRHNLVLLSRLPVQWQRQYWHDLVPAPKYLPVTAEPSPEVPQAVEWDRPVLHVALDLAAGRTLHVFNLHLRAPLAAPVAGQKQGPLSWRSVAGWAEGFYMASLKRSGQALEARLAVDRIFDQDRDALIAVCGDFNASAREVPVRIVMGHADDTGNPDLAHRALVPLEQDVPSARRYSVLHDGRVALLDHMLVSQGLAALYRGAEIHNEDLRDEVRDAAADPHAAVSYHAPVVASFDLPGA